LSFATTKSEIQIVFHVRLMIVGKIALYLEVFFWMFTICNDYYITQISILRLLRTIQLILAKKELTAVAVNYIIIMKLKFILSV